MESTDRRAMPDVVAAASHSPSLAMAVAAPSCEIRNLGQTTYRRALAIQADLVRARKAGSLGDQLLFVEHPPTITLGRNADSAHVLATSDRLGRMGIAVEETDRGGDVTYHGPGQVVAYPILDLREWRRDVGAYLRALEEVMIAALTDFGIRAGRIEGLTGVWVGEAKIGALGVHLSRWVTSHGLALNVSTDLRCFEFIVPCGLMRPVTSMERILGRNPGLETVIEAVAGSFGKVFGRSMIWSRART